MQQMIAAINRNDTASLQKLLDEGADPNAKFDSGADFTYYGNLSILIWAAASLSAEGVEVLLKAGANPNFCSTGGSGSGRTALYEACNGSDEETAFKIVDLLLKAGANPDEVGNGDNLPLSAAARNGHDEICKRLIEAGAAFKTWPEKCGPPLVFAAGGGLMGATKPQKHDRVIQLLLDLGAPVDGENVGWTPLAQAAYIGNEYRVDLFLNRGADANRKDKYGRTPLIDAALYYQTGTHNEETEQLAFRMIKRLLQSGADPGVREMKGKTAADIVLEKIAPKGSKESIASYINNFRATS